MTSLTTGLIITAAVSALMGWMLYAAFTAPLGWQDEEADRFRYGKPDDDLPAA